MPRGLWSLGLLGLGCDGRDPGDTTDRADSGADTDANTETDTETTCLALDLGDTVPQDLAGDPLGRGDDATPTCAPAGAEDLACTFTARARGRYAFLLSGPDHPGLSLNDGCGGTERVCDPVRIEADLVAGQVVGLGVDGSGPFDLRIVLRVHRADRRDVPRRHRRLLVLDRAVPTTACRPRSSSSSWPGRR